jgi:hypothetical protein
MIRSPATWMLPSVPSIEGHETTVRRWRYGQVVLVDGQVARVDARWWPRWTSVWGAITEQIARTLPTEECRFYYAFPRRSPDYLSLLYVHAGPQTSYRTFHRGIVAIEAIARSRNARGIVCQVTNHRLTERLMGRWGYERHALRLGGDHYIHRLSPKPRSGESEKVNA